MKESVLHRAQRLEMALRASYLATGLEVNFFAWVDMGIVRKAIEDSKTKHKRKLHDIPHIEIEEG